MKKFGNRKAGISILGLLIVAVLVILLLSYFNISVRSVVESPSGQDNIHYVGGGTKTLWDTYLKDPASYLWNDVWVPIFWRPFISNMENIIHGQPTELDKASANLQKEQQASQSSQ